MKSFNSILKTKHQVIICCLVLFSFQCYGQISFVKQWTPPGYNMIYHFVELPDSTFILSASQQPSISTETNALVMRCNKNGDSLYSFKYDSCLSGSIVLLNDSEVVTPGLYGNFPFTHLGKLNFLTGDTILIKSYPCALPTGFLHRCPDGGYLMLNWSGGNYTYIKVDSNYNMEWHKSSNMAYDAWQIKPDPLGGYVAVGNHGFTSNPYAVQRLDSAGNIIWSYGYGDVSFPNWSQYYIASDVVIADDGNYIVSCLENNINFMKINRLNGDTIWTKKNINKQAFLINNAGNDTYITVTDSFGLLNGNGNFVWQTPVVPSSWNINYIKHCAKTLDGGYAFCGQTSNYQTMVFVKLDSMGNTVNTAVYDVASGRQLRIYPNPVSDVLNFSSKQTTGNFTFSVYNFSGNKVIEVKNKTSVDVSALPAGFYVAEVTESPLTPKGGKGNMVVREKFVKE